MIKWALDLNPELVALVEEIRGEEGERAGE
jgi:hypothetical protein